MVMDQLLLVAPVIVGILATLLVAFLIDLFVRLFFLFKLFSL